MALGTDLVALQDIHAMPNDIRENARGLRVEKKRSSASEPSLCPRGSASSQLLRRTDVFVAAMLRSKALSASGRIAHTHLGVIAALIALTIPSVASPEAAKMLEEAPAKPTVMEDGSIYIPAVTVPLSSYMSLEAKKRFIEETNKAIEEDNEAKRDAASRVADEKSAAARTAEDREWVDKWYKPKVERAKRLYPAIIEERRIAGVRSHIVTPAIGIPQEHRQRVLINLHGGGFMFGGVWGGLAESIPVAVVGNIKVITVDYRMAPEHKFPAASEDVALVYAALLKQYKPENIGMYGCSAGGALTASAVAWMQVKGLPRPGAIGIFCAGMDRHFGGDSVYIAGLLDVSLGLPPAPFPPKPNPPPIASSNPYLREGNPDDPLMWPGNHPDILRQFPPTLLISGTRDMALSAALYAHRQLTKVGVEADLHVWEGMGHNFLVEMDLPESREAYEEIAKFFNKQLAYKRQVH